jgi:hypothetical protein
MFCSFSARPWCSFLLFSFLFFAFALDERNHVQFFCIVRLYRSIKIDLSSMAAAAAAAAGAGQQSFLISSRRSHGSGGSVQREGKEGGLVVLGGSVEKGGSSFFGKTKFGKHHHTPPFSSESSTDTNSFLSLAFLSAFRNSFVFPEWIGLKAVAPHVLGIISTPMRGRYGPSFLAPFQRELLCFLCISLRLEPSERNPGGVTRAARY